MTMAKQVSRCELLFIVRWLWAALLLDVNLGTWGKSQVEPKACRCLFIDFSPFHAHRFRSYQCLIYYLLTQKRLI